jgi:SLOG family YspA-like protein
MKLAVVGKKEYTNYKDFRNVLDQIKGIKKIISGGAVGTDAMAKRYAEESGIEFQEFPPQYELYSVEAKHNRDRRIVENCDRVLAFWDGNCEGTSYTMKYAMELNIPIKIIRL